MLIEKEKVSGPKIKPEVKIKPDYLEAYRTGLVGFIEVMDHADRLNQLNNPTEFVSILSVGITRFNLRGSELASALHVSKGATSKWVNGEALPNRPTQIAAIEWVPKNAR